MDVIKKFLGLQHKTDGQVIFSTSPDSSNDNIDNDISEKKILEPTPVPSFLAEKYPWLENAFRINEDDCASCKYIGSSISYGVSIFLLTQLNNPPKELVGKKLPFYGIIIPLSFTFFILGTNRLFDIGICKHPLDGTKKSLMDFVKEDVDDIVKYFDTKNETLSNVFHKKELNIKQNSTQDSVKKDK